MDPLISTAILAATGAASGFSSGLFGVGGGFLMVPVQYWLFLTGGIGSTLATRLAFGTSLAVMLPTMISSAASHHRQGAVDWHAAIPLGIGAVLGGLAGGTLAAHLPGNVLRTIFSLVVIAMAVRMVWHVHECSVCDRRGSKGIFLVLGALIGIVSGLAGIGGGILLVPVLVILLGYPVHTAVGTSSACLIFSSAGSVTAYIINGLSVPCLPPFSLGYVSLLPWTVLAATTVPLSRLGVHCAHACHPRTLQVVFAGIMVLIGVLMLANG